MLQLTPEIALADDEIEWQAIRAQGPGGQNVNKVASAMQLRFDVRASSLPDPVKQRLLALPDRRISADGVVVIKAQRHRTREQNRADAVERLRVLVVAASRAQKRRRPTRPTLAARQRRLDAKAHRGRLKRQRRTLDD